MQSNATEFLVEKLERKRPLSRPRCRWVYNIKIDSGGIRCEIVDFIYLSQDKAPVIVYTVMKFYIPYKAISFWTN
jgi:hypothetical protein